MNEKLINKCLSLVQEKFPNLPEEEIEKFAEDLYIRFLERMLLKFGDMVDEEVLAELTPLLDDDDEENLFIEMNKYTSFDELLEETYQEVRETYLK